MINYTFKIYDETWNAYLVDDNDDVIADADSAAETDFDKKEIYFRSGDLSLIIVWHELFHAFVGYSYIQTASLTQYQMEEVSCEIFAYRWETIVKLGETIYKEMDKVRDNP